MKIEKFIISAILVFALTNYAYGMGRHHHHHHRGGNSGGITTTDNSGGNGITVQDFNDSNNSVPVSVPEPVTILLVGSGLIGLAGLARKKFKK